MLTFDNTTLQTKEISTIRHRSECDTSVEFCGVQLDIPIVASPMPDVCNGELARSMAILGGMAIIHRFQSIDDQVKNYRYATGRNMTSQLTDVQMARIGCAIGATDDYLERILALVSAGCSLFCVDTANGANAYVQQTLKVLNTLYKNADIAIISGNVANIEGFNYLDSYSNAIRVGIAGGSVCETKTETGIHTPTLESVFNIAHGPKTLSQIIADGGIRTPSDMNKALVAGADVVMVGGILVATKESPAKVVKVDGKFYKMYRGAASYSVQQDMGKIPYYNEGDETLVPFDLRTTVEHVLNRFKAGLQSSMSYANAKDLATYRTNTQLVKL